MAIGLFTPDITVTDRLSRVLGAVTATTSSGSISVPEFVNGTPWYAERYANVNVGGAGRTVSISGTTLSWSSWVSGSTITYGIY